MRVAMKEYVNVNIDVMFRNSNMKILDPTTPMTLGYSRNKQGPNLMNNELCRVQGVG